jgi:GNAT superfamily N-acetyltransferase
VPTVRELDTDADWDRAVPILGQLWRDADESFVRSFRAEPDYRLFGLFVGDEDTLVAVAGVSVQRVLHHARHAWVHDLVVDEPVRGEGHGAALLGAVEDWARERDCEYVALAVRDGNDEARRFYEREGLAEWGRVLEREL